MHPVEGVFVEVHQQTPCQYQRSQDVTCPRYKFAKPVQLFCEWCFHTVVYLCSRENLSIFGCIAYTCNTKNAVPLHYFRATQNVVGGKGGIVVELFWLYTLLANGFARKCRLVHTQRYGVEKLAVGWYVCACVEQDNVAHDNFAFRNVRCIAVSYHFYKFLIVYLV